MLRNALQLLGSQAQLAVVGLLAVPVLAVQLGPAAYGDFSIFLLVAGMLIQLDVSRPILIRELSRELAPARALDSVAFLNLLLLGGVAGLAGWALLGPWGGLICLAVVLPNAASMPEYAVLAARDRIGVTGLVRNSLWSAALVAAAVIAAGTDRWQALAAAFFLANALTWILYRRFNRGHRRETPRLRWAGVPREHLPSVGRVLVFGAAMTAMLTLDRVLLRGQVERAEYGVYMTACDLALKMNVVGMAIGNVLYPALSRAMKEGGREAADAALLRVLRRTVPLVFLACLAGMWLARPLLPWLLGEDFAGVSPIFSGLLVGVFLQFLGFQLTPWQRACGDFVTQRNAYVAGAAAMLVAGLLLIPRYGAAGALGAYLCGRVAECWLIAHFALRAVPGSLRRAECAAVPIMSLLLAASAYHLYRGGA